MMTLYKFEAILSRIKISDKYDSYCYSKKYMQFERLTPSTFRSFGHTRQIFNKRNGNIKCVLVRFPFFLRFVLAFVDHLSTIYDLQSRRRCLAGTSRAIITIKLTATPELIIQRHACAPTLCPTKRNTSRR